MIEVNEYVRTKNGVIDKIDALYGMIENTVHLENQKWFDIKNIVNHSKQLIDLVEVGDYVNGHLVVEISKNAYNQKIVITEVDGKDGAIRHHYLERSIKNVVTHEQFESIEYKVEEGK